MEEDEFSASLVCAYSIIDEIYMYIRSHFFSLTFVGSPSFVGMRSSTARTPRKRDDTRNRVIVARAGV